MDVVTVLARARLEGEGRGDRLPRCGAQPATPPSRGLVPVLISLALLARFGVAGDDPVDRSAQSSHKVLVGDAATERSRPACRDVLAPRATLPVDLHEGGCRQGDGTILLPGVSVCDDGSELLVHDHLAGYLGGEANAIDAGDEEWAVLFEDRHD